MDGRDRLAQWIERSILNQLEAARIIGIDHTQLNQILGGKRRPGLDNAIKIERATGIAVEAWESIEDDRVVAVGSTKGRKPLISKA